MDWFRAMMLILSFAAAAAILFVLLKYFRRAAPELSPQRLDALPRKFWKWCAAKKLSWWLSVLAVPALAGAVLSAAYLAALETGEPALFRYTTAGVILIAVIAVPVAVTGGTRKCPKCGGAMKRARGDALDANQGLRYKCPACGEEL